MATDERRRQKKLARKRSKEKEARRELARRRAGGVALRIAQVSSAPVLHCMVDAHLFERGIGQLLVSRELRSGDVAVGVFLLDVYCLGVKNAFGMFISRADYDGPFMNGFRGEESYRAVTLEFARKLVEELVEYAEQLGFRPHADFRKAYAIFGDVDATRCDEEFEFGHEGQPYFVSGPFDSPERCRQIHAQLIDSVGEGNFQFLIAIDPQSRDAAVLRDFVGLAERLPHSDTDDGDDSDAGDDSGEDDDGTE